MVALRDKTLGIAIVLLAAAPAASQKYETNYDESKVPQYTLPDPLVLSAGGPVADAQVWREKRRPEILGLFEEHVYGRTPRQRVPLRVEVRSVATDALEGTATRKQVRLHFSQADGGPKMDLLIYLPNGSPRPVPLFVGLNFHGNHTIHSDPGIAITEAWVRNDPEVGITNHRTSERARGRWRGRWAVDEILRRGYGLATAYYGDLDPDYDDGFQNGVHALFRKEGEKRRPDDWASIGAWAWGLSRAMDYFETDPDVDAKHVAVMGHSRLGKTALWAGAQDERFAIVISNNSGAGGAALARRRFGESLKASITLVPWWYCENYRQYADREDRLPVDQHMLVALVAPRPVYVASAEEDRWADPRGEFLAAKGADPVYRILGTDGLPAQNMPPLDTPVLGTIGYHVRRGKHTVTEYDWQRYLDFADRARPQ
ncbi:MAG TPA: acetylxylan esterase [Thermoguttaceae bacterium]|nr:acetylxylan esterase [Thermoguttaceae bacterium]